MANNFGRKDLLGLGFHITFYHEWKTGQEVKQSSNPELGADTEAIEEYCLLAPHGLLSLFSYRTQNYQLRNATIHLAVSLTHQTLIKKFPKVLPIAQCYRGVFLIEIATPQMSSDCVILT